MDKGEKRRITWLAIAIVLMVINVLFIFVSLPIIAIVALDYAITKPKNKDDDSEYEVPIEEENYVDKIRAHNEKIESQREYEKNYRKTVDLRQFKGRNDVDKKEVANYLWFHKIWEGRREKEIICEEIAKVSNITNEDIDWIMHEHYNHQGNDGSVGGGHWIRNEETKRELEYERKKTREQNEELNKKFKSLKINHKMNDKYKYIFYYEDWLKEKGYI